MSKHDHFSFRFHCAQVRTFCNHVFLLFQLCYLEKRIAKKLTQLIYFIFPLTHKKIRYIEPPVAQFKGA